MTNDDKALVGRLRAYPCEYCDTDCTKAADRIEALNARLAEADALLEKQNDDIGRLREANRFLRRGLYGHMDSDDADSIATTIETGGIVDWDKYPTSARAALGEQQ